jgi:hypothetical protein
MTLLAIDTFDKQRFGLVTGSRCTPLVPKRSAEVGQTTLAKQLASELFFQFYDERSTWQTEHGKMSEVFAHEHFKKYFNEDIESGRWIKSGDTGGNTDAEALEYGVDYKCPTTLKAWLDYLFDGISDEEYNQCQLYMKLTKKPKWLIAAYLCETNLMSDNGLKYPVEEKDRMIICEVLPDKAWNEKFDSNLPVVIEKRDEYLEKLRVKFGII